MAKKTDDVILGGTIEITGIKESIRDMKDLSKTLSDMSSQIKKIEYKTEYTNELLKNENYLKAQLELKKAQLQLNNKLKNSEEMLNLLAKNNTEQETAKYRLREKKAKYLLADKEYQKSVVESKKAELRLYEKTNYNAKTLNALAKHDRRDKVASLKLEIKKNKEMAKSKTYLKSYVEYYKSIQLKQDAINKALTDAGLKTNKELVKLKGWFKGIAKSAITFFSVRKLGSILAGTVKQTASWVENLNLFAVTFGDNYKDTLDWALEFSNRLGVSNNEIVKMTGLFKQLSSAIGIADDTGDALSQTLTRLAYDFSSFYNIEDIESVVNKLQSGIFSGQVKTLRSIGIDVSQESIDTLLKTTESLAKLGTSATQLSQTQKVIARVILTMKSGANAFGDMSRSIDTFQNRIRVFKGSLENFKLAVGDLVTGPVRDAMAYVNAFIQALTIAIRQVTPIRKELTYDLGDNIFTEATEDLDEFKKGLGLLSFDKFEVLSTSDKNEDLSITNALTEELKKQQEIYDKQASQFSGIDEQTKKIRDNILDWIFPYRTEKELGKLNPALVLIRETLRTILKIFTDIAKAVKKVMSPIFNLMNTITTWLDKNNMLFPILQGVVAIFISSKIIKGITGITLAIKSLNSGLLGLSAGFAVFTLLNSISENFDNVTKGIFGMATAFLSLAVAIATAVSPLSSAVKIPILLASVGAGLAGITSMIDGIKGFEVGGIPSKSELFYMNEGGVPEALINTGGSQTNVVNMKQLKEMTKQGFVEAIKETGLINGNKIIIEGRNINDSSIARGLFPALKSESSRRGGNQL